MMKVKLNQAKFHKILFISIIILAITLRFYGISSESYWLDETISIKLSQYTFSEIVQELNSGAHVPLHSFALKIWTTIFGLSEFATRSLSAIFGVLSVIAIYYLGRKKSNEIGLIASFLLAINPYAIFYSQETRLYSMFLFFTITTFYYFYELFDKGLFVKQSSKQSIKQSSKQSIKESNNQSNKQSEHKSNKQLIKTIALYVISTILMLYTHSFALLVLAIQTIIVLFKYRHQFGTWVGIHILTFILYLPALIKFLILFLTKKNIPAPIWIHTPSFIDFKQVLVDFSGSWLLLEIIMYSFVIGVLFYKKFNWELLLWGFVSVMFAYLISVTITPIMVSRYLIFALPGLILLFSDVVAKFDKEPKLTLLFIFLIVSSLMVNIQHQTVDKTDWKNALNYLKENANPEDTIFLVPYYSQFPVGVYYDNSCLNVYNYDTSRGCQHERKIVSFVDLDKCCNDYILFWDRKTQLYEVDIDWIVESNSNLFDNGEILNFMLSRYDIVENHTFFEVQILKVEKKSEQIV